MTTTRTTPLRHGTGVGTAFALNGLGMATWIARTPDIRDGLGLDFAQMGVLLFTLSAGSLAGLAASGTLLGRLGPRRTILAMLSICAVGLVLIGAGSDLLHSVPLAVVGFVLYGFSTGACDVGMNVEGADVEQRAGRTLLPMFHALWSGGTVLGAGVAALLAGAAVPLAVHASVVAVVVVIGAALATRPMRGALPAADTDEHASVGARLRTLFDPRTLAIGAVILGMAFTEGSANDWLTLALHTERDFSTGAAAGLFTVFTVSMTVSRLVGGPIVDRVGRVPVLRVSAIAAGVGLLLVILVPATPVTVVGIVLWGLGAALGFPLGMSAAADDPTKAAARVGAVAIIGYSAFLVGPPVLGLLGEHVGLFNALLVIVVLIAVAALAAPAARERGPQGASADAAGSGADGAAQSDPSHE